MHPIIRQYCKTVEFLGKALGPQYEIVLHDLTTDEDKIVAIVNNHISGRSSGAPLTGLALQFVADKVYEQEDYKVNYRGTSRKQQPLRSSTMFIKDEDGTLLGMMCINYDASAYFETVEALAKLFQIPTSQHGTERGAEEEAEETFPESMPEVIRSVLKTSFEETHLPVSRLTQEEKLKIVDRMDKKGVFRLKGSVSEVAKQLSSSEATIYRYLSKLNKGRT